ncbi:succinate dehydrogenase, cytochrome b556 subunit, partial [Caballeronia sp. LZ024]|nr:succinate dehydrogenase, cytochrome b556 subunit [Caballeronia sp. LZ024]MDR5754663.1 succinate dehydrogenase, cytochrome b556 subunit [Caballeronia sp. LZ024]
MAEAVKKPRPEFRNIGIGQIAKYRLPLAGKVS